MKIKEFTSLVTSSIGRYYFGKTYFNDDMHKLFISEEVTKKISLLDQPIVDLNKETLTLECM
jgi:hypothetical protein